MSTDEPGTTPAAEGNPAAAAATEPAPGAPKPMTKKQKRNQIIRSLIGLVATGIVLYFVFKWFQSQGASIQQVATDIKGMPTWAIGGLILAAIFNVLVYPTPYPAMTFGLKYRPAFVIKSTSFTISNTIPFGGAVGLGVQYGMFATYDVAPTAIATTLTISSVWTQLMTLGLPVFGLLGLVAIGEASSQEVKLGLLGLLGVIVMIGALVIILRSVKGAEWVGRVGQASIGWFFKLLHKTPPDVVAAVLKFRVGTVDVLKQRWWRITWTNLLAQSGMFLILWFAVAGLTASTNGKMPSVVEVFAAFAISKLGTLIPIPGGLGPTDALLVQMLQSFGCTSSVAVAADLVWRIMYFAVQVSVGVVTFVYWEIASNRKRRKAVGATQAV